MRNTLIELLINRIKKKDYFLTADLGFSVLEKIKLKIKERFINVGVSENNMMLIAAGLATRLTKNHIYVYSISSFLISRTLEIIKIYFSNDEIKNIRMIGVGPGASYSTMGKTHFNFDDINYIYNLKNILILNPSNEDELKFVFKKFNQSKRSIYYRLNKNLKKNNNFFYKKGNINNIICSGSIINYLPEIVGKKLFNSFNIISLPILDLNYCKNIEKFLVKGKVYCITDAIKPIFFFELKEKLKKKECKILDLDIKKIKKVGSESQILKQMGLRKEFFLK